MEAFLKRVLDEKKNLHCIIESALTQINQNKKHIQVIFNIFKYLLIVILDSYNQINNIVDLLI